jgi:hypothetical protein
MPSWSSLPPARMAATLANVHMNEVAGGNLEVPYSHHRQEQPLATGSRRPTRTPRLACWKPCVHFLLSSATRYGVGSGERARWRLW